MEKSSTILFTNHLFGILAYFFLDVLKERIDTFISSLIEPPRHADTTSSREMIWQRAFELIERKPFFGYGADANNMLFESYRKKNSGII